MRVCLALLLAPLLTGCALRAADEAPPGAAPLTWTGAFGGGPSSPGKVMLLLDETGPTWRGTMFFETDDLGAGSRRATYRIDGAIEDGVVRLEQREIVEADAPLGLGWCLGTYELTLGDGIEKPKLTGSYAAETRGCGGTTSLQPVDEL